MLKLTKISLSLILFSVSFLFAQSTKLSGEIVAFEEDNKTQISIVVYVDSLDELESYMIKNTGKGVELKNKNGQHVEVSGTIATDENDENWVTVTSYKIIKIEDEDSEDTFTETDTLDENATKNQWNDY